MRIVFLVMMLSLPSFSNNGTSLFCSTYYGIKYLDDVEWIDNDKVKHCTISCMIALKCVDWEVDMLGHIKEFFDALGFGTPDQNDIKANRKGIAISKNLDDKDQCYDPCYEAMLW